MPTPPIESGPPQDRPEQEAYWSRTLDRTELLKLMGRFYEEPTGDNKLGEADSRRPAKYGWYKNRHVIGRDERINGGIYLGAGGREEIVIDDTKDTASYDEVYARLMSNVANRQSEQQQLGEDSGFKNGILTDVYDTVQQTLQYDEEFASQMADQYRDQKIELGVFIGSGKGVCRHQALLAGYLLERLKDEGKIRGTVSVDRNSIPGRGAHAWARYTSHSGDVNIIDPAQDYAGLIDNVPENGWFYRRPEDS